MTHEDSRTVLARERALRRRHVVGQRRQRVLNDGDPVASADELVIDAAPARTIGKGAMHQHDVFRLHLLGMGAATGTDDAGGCRSCDQKLANQ
nr:hypothetical protein [Variovorax boronicumulans]